MDNRFGFKDLVFSVLLVGVIVSIWLAMVQFDRQYDAIRAIAEQLKQQTSAQARMERLLAEVQMALEAGVTVGTGTATAGHNPHGEGQGGGEASFGDPFARIREARAQPDYAEGDWLIDVFGAQVARITPLISGDAYGAAIQGRVLETLATRDPDTLEWRPLLARSWQVQDNREAWQAYLDRRLAEPLTEQEVRNEPGFPTDGTAEEQRQYVQQRLEEGRRVNDIVSEPDAPPAMVITFQMRRGITFSDGEPLSAEDVQFTYDLIMNEQIDAPRARNYIRDQIRSVRATKPDEVVFEFKKPYFESFELAASFEVLPKHFYGDFEPDRINTDPGLLLGSGPYRLESPTGWAPGDPLVLVRNERYWGVRPAFDRLVYREINNDVARLTAFRNGEVDIFPAQPEQYIELKEDPEVVERAQHFEYERPNAGYQYIAWNQRRNGEDTFFADPRVRRAMTMLTDRQRVIDRIFKGYGFVVTGPFNRLSEQYNHDIEPWPYDPSQARALLAEAGFEDRNGDGVIESPDGEPFVFNLTYPSGSTLYDEMVLLFRDNYAKAGIVLRPDPLEWSVFGEKLKSRDFDAITLRWTGGVETDVHQMFHSDNIGHGADNFMSYSNPELDRLIDEARFTLDEERRMELWQQVHAILHQDQPYSFLFSNPSLIFLDDRIQNVERVRLGLNDRVEWYVPEPLQKY